MGVSTIAHLLIEGAKILALSVLVLLAAVLVLGGLALCDEWARTRMGWYRAWRVRRQLRRLYVGKEDQ